MPAASGPKANHNNDVPAAIEKQGIPEGDSDGDGEILDARTFLKNGGENGTFNHISGKSMAWHLMAGARSVEVMSGRGTNKPGIRWPLGVDAWPIGSSRRQAALGRDGEGRRTRETLLQVGVVAQEGSWEGYSSQGQTACPTTPVV